MNCIILVKDYETHKIFDLKIKWYWLTRCQRFFSPISTYLFSQASILSLTIKIKREWDNFMFRLYRVYSRVDLTCKSIILCTINCHTKKIAYGNAISFLFFFYGHSMKSLSAINLYGQLMTLKFFLYGHTMIFMFFLEVFLTNNFQFGIYIVSSNSMVVKTSRFKRNARQQLPEFSFSRFCLERKTHTFTVVCPTLHHWRLYFSGIWFHKFSFFNFTQPKMNVNGIYYVPQLYFCQKFWTSHFNVMFSFLVKFLFTRIRYHSLIKFAHAFPYHGHTMVQCMTCMDSYNSMVFLWLVCYHKLLWNFLWLSCFHRWSAYMTFYDFRFFSMVVNPGYAIFTFIFENHVSSHEWQVIQKFFISCRQFSKISAILSAIKYLNAALFHGVPRSNSCPNFFHDKSV